MGLSTLHSNMAGFAGAAAGGLRAGGHPASAWTALEMGRKRWREVLQVGQKLVLQGID